MEKQNINKKVIEVNVGLDIGIASCGWCIAEVETNKIVDHGSRLFDTVDDKKDSKLANETRREKRLLRRQEQRYINRNHDFISLLIKPIKPEFKIINDIEYDRQGNFIYKFIDKYINNPDLKKDLATKYGNLYNFKLRQKGLKEALPLNELLVVLFWYMHHRGFKYNVIDSDDKNDESKISTTINSYLNDVKNDKDFVVNAQLAYINEYGFLHGKFNRNFHTDKYKREIETILKNQNLSILSIEFQQKYLKLFSQQRNFAWGPGKENTPTPYGKFWEFKRNENGTFNLVKCDQPYKTIWEKTVGKCTIFPSEYRAPKDCVTSQIFNLLNDLNNISNIELGLKLNNSQKIEIINLALKTKNASEEIFNKIKEPEFLNANPDKELTDIKGYRFNKKDKEPIFSELGVFHDIKKAVGVDFSISSIIDVSTNKIIENNLFDQIAIVLNQYRTKEERLAEIKKLNEKKKINFELNDDQIARLTELKGFSQNHSLSFKAMQTIIPLLLKQSRNSQQIITCEEYKEIFKKTEHNKQENEGNKYLSTFWIDDKITTPTVKRSLRQSIKVLSAIFSCLYEIANDGSKDYKYVLKDIVIEMARERNNKEQREMISDSQEFFKAKKDNIIKTYNLNDEQASKGFLINKLWLHEQQRGFDVYTGEKIDYKDIINNSKGYDIDHIIPRSQSFDNSRSNTVLTSSANNSNKGNNTPFRYLDKNKFLEMKRLWAIWYLPSKEEKSNDKKTKNKSKINKEVFTDRQKYENLTSELDFSNPNNQVRFINRNLVDTRYTTSELLNYLNDFKKEHNLNFNVKTVNGKMTSFIRSCMEKPRFFKNKNKTQEENENEYKKWKDATLNRPNGIQLLNKENKKNRDWNGHHAEDAYIITILNNFYSEGKYIENVLSSIKNPDKAKAIGTKILSNLQYLIDAINIGRSELNRTLNDIKFSRLIIEKQGIPFYSETLYSGKRINENTVQKIESFNLIKLTQKKASELFDPANKKYNGNNVLMFKEEPECYKALQEIYFNNKCEKEDDLPFKKYVSSKNIHLVKVEYIKKDKKINRTVGKIKVLAEEKPIIDIALDKNNKNCKNNKCSFFEGLNFVEIHLYKNKKDEWKVIPVNVSNHNIVKDNKNKLVCVPKLETLNKQKEERNIDINAPISLVIKRGTTFISPQSQNGQRKIIYASGVGNGSTNLEFKYLEASKKNFSFEKQVWEEKERIFLSFKQLKGWTLVNVNMLGKIRERKFKF